jgi:hypothetical protein
MGKRRRSVPQRHPTVVRRSRDSRLRQLGEVQAFVAGTLKLVNVRCGRKGCHCADGDGHPSNYLAMNINGKKVTRYIRKEDLADVRKLVSEYKRLKKLVKEISELSMELIAAEAYVRRTQKRRQRQR